MAERLQLDIVTPYGSVYTGDVDEVVAPGEEGEFGVLPNHIPFITTLKIGMLTCKDGQQTIHFFVNRGFAEVGPDRVIVLADSAERAEDIDIERAREAKKRAEERLRQIENIDEARARAALERAITRIEIAEKYRTGR